MDRLSGSSRLLSRLLEVRYSTLCHIVVAFLLARVAIAATHKSSPLPIFRGGCEFASKNSFNSENSSHPLSEGSDFLIGVVRNFSCRVFQLAEDPQQNWPKLQLGWRTVSAVILGGIGAALSSAGGLGGGGLFVPLFNLLLQFDAKTSAALSNFMILGGSVANLYINLRQRHPTVRHKPLIDFDVVLLLQPNMLLGISTGVILNVILPDWVITALLTITLGYMTIHSFKGGVRRWKKETNQNQRKVAAEKIAAEKIAAENGAPMYVTAPDFHHHHSEGSESSFSSSSSSSSSSDDDDDIPPVAPNPLFIVAVDEEDQEEIRKSSNSSRLEGKQSENEAGERELTQPLLRKSSHKESIFPVDKVLALAFTWLAFFVVQVLRGSKSNESILGLEACGLGYWLLTLSQIPFAFSITGWTIRRLGASHASSLVVAGSTENLHQEEGFVLTPKSCTLLAWMALIAGLLGGLLGIGGGMIVNPLLLTVGMVPQVTAGTCASMVFFSSSMSVVQFWLMGRVPLDYALSAAVLCALCSSAGVILVHRAIDKYNRASIIVFSVTAVMGVSSILMGGFGGYGVWKRYISGDYMGFHNFC